MMLVGQLEWLTCLGFGWLEVSSLNELLGQRGLRRRDHLSGGGFDRVGGCILPARNRNEVKGYRQQASQL